MGSFGAISAKNMGEICSLEGAKRISGRARRSNEIPKLMPSVARKLLSL
jgi:hypothetical protein